MKDLIALAETGTYYQLLGTSADSPRAMVRQSYYKIVRKFHPDHHMDHAEWIQPLHKLTEAVTVAYKTLTDEAARQKYDEHLASSRTFALGRPQSDSQRTAEDCLEKARECLKAQNSGGTILWLRKAAEIEPNSQKYHSLLARALSKVTPLRYEAIQHFEKALDLDPSNTTVRFQAATLCEEMKLPWRARDHYRKILEIDASNAKAQNRLRMLDDHPGRDGASKRSITDRILRRSPR
jgi:Flp pilus assembly protein TadD